MGQHSIWLHAPHASLRLGAALPVRSVRGRCALSELYELTLEVSLPRAEPFDVEEVDELLRHPVSMVVAEGADEMHGVIREVVATDTPTREDATWGYRMTLVPRLWRLSLSRGSRVFQDLGPLDIAMQVLASHEVPARLEVDPTAYPPRDYTVQYEETDLTFVRRLLEHQGVHFRFESTPDGEVVVLSDHNASFGAHSEPLSFHVLRPQEPGPPAVFALEHRRRPGPATVALRDYDWRRSASSLEYRAAADEPTGVGTWDEYGAHLRGDAEGERLVLARAEEAAVRCEVLEGQTSWLGMRPGARFTVLDHPNPLTCQDYVALSTQDELHADALPRATRSFAAIPYDVPYRPARVSPRPVVRGLLNAVIDGEHHSVATPVDEEGRYRVVLPLDLSEASAGRASRWIRRAQPSAGVNCGFHFPLHIGTEVAVAHVNGDPDRPVIVGAVPNRATPSPVGQGNATQHRFVSPGGAMLEFEEDCG